MKKNLVEVEKQYGISTYHSEMDNGERRFRLRKDGFPMYIRTEATKDSKWQEAHVHSRVYETYIVQNGWLGFAEVIEKGIKFTIYKEGDVFTTKPDIYHNVYLPADAVIHTVKHGDTKKEVRTDNDPMAKKLTEITKQISEDELKEKAMNEIPVDLNAYNEVYRHFDNLIWQVPTFASGIFIAVIIGTMNIKNSSMLEVAAGLSIPCLSSLVYGFSSLFLFILSYTLYRFRWHQINAKNYKPKNHFKSPQVYLQFIINLQVCMLLAIAVNYFNIVLLNIMSIVLSFFISAFMEESLILEDKKAISENKTKTKLTSTKS